MTTEASIQNRRVLGLVAIPVASIVVSAFLAGGGPAAVIGHAAGLLLMPAIVMAVAWFVALAINRPLTFGQAIVGFTVLWGAGVLLQLAA